jgi:hypothetical protein
MRRPSARRAARARLDRVGDSDEAGRLTIDSNQHDPLALASPGFGCAGERRRVDGKRRQESVIADRHSSAADRGDRALAGFGVEVTRSR